MRFIFLVLTLASWETVAQSCGQELEALKGELEAKEKQCKEADNTQQYENDLAVVESEYRSKFAAIATERRLAIDKLKAKYGIR